MGRFIPTSKSEAFPDILLAALAHKIDDKLGDLHDRLDVTKWQIDADTGDGPRSNYDAEAKGFTYYDSTASYIYVKKSDASGDWSDGLPWDGTINEVDVIYITQGGEKRFRLTSSGTSSSIAVTTDDGANWTTVYDVDEGTGVVDFQIQPTVLGAPFVIQGARKAATADVNLYVNGNTGSDNNTGGSGDPFEHIGTALLEAAKYDFKSHHCYINLQDSTFAENVNVNTPWVGGSGVTIKGNAVTPANTLLSGTGHALAINTPLPNPLRVQDFKVETSSGCGLRVASVGVHLQYAGMDFGDVTQAQVLNFRPGSFVETVGDNVISGGAQRHIYVHNNAFFRSYAHDYTLVDTPAFSNEFILIQEGGGAVWVSNQFLGTGATGRRYHVNTHCFLDVTGQGQEFFPGTIAGVVQNQGWYQP